MFWIRPSSQGGSTDYGLGLLEENFELSQVNYITDDSGLAIFQRDSVEGSSSLIIIQGHLEVTLFIYYLSLSSLDSAADGSDIGHLNLNNNNNLTLTNGAAGTNGPYNLVVFVKTAAFLIEDSMGNVALSFSNYIS